MSLSAMDFSEAMRGRDFKFGDAPNIVESEDVQRVGHCQKQFIIQSGNGNNLVIVGHVARHQFRNFRDDAHARQIDWRHVQYPTHGDRQVLITDVSLFKDELDQAAFLLSFAVPTIPQPGRRSAGRLRPARRRCVRQMI